MEKSKDVVGFQDERGYLEPEDPCELVEHPGRRNVGYSTFTGSEPQDSFQVGKAALLDGAIDHGKYLDQIKAVEDSEVTLEEATWHSVEFIGCPLREAGAHSERWGSGIKVGIIDSYAMADPDPALFNFMSRPPLIQRTFHYCSERTRLSNHGIFCTSLIAGKTQRADFFEMCEGHIRGVAPAATIMTYALGCIRCGMRPDHMCDAIRAAISDRVDIISCSLGFRRLDARPLTASGDSVGEATLEALKSGIATCLSAGNYGPRVGTIGWGIPWCLNVGACSNEHVVTTKVEVAVLRGGQFKRVDDIEGISVNPYTMRTFVPLLLDASSTYEDSVLLVNRMSHTRQTEAILTGGDRGKSAHANYFQITSHPQAALDKADTDRLWELKRLHGDVYVKISVSKFQRDNRPPFVADYSSRGPSPTYKEIMMPNLVAPGTSILGGWSRKLQLVENDNLMSDQCIKTGTSFACPLAAGSMAYLKWKRPDLSPSALISAMMTTARSLRKKATGNEFASGAGIIDVTKAVKPGLLFEETPESFEKYRQEHLDGRQLNLPSFAACIPASHKPYVCSYVRKVKNDDASPMIYYSKIVVDHNTLDPSAKIEVKPATLDFTTQGQIRYFKLTCTVTPTPQGYISGRLIWASKKFQETRRKVVARFIFSDVSLI